MHQRWRSVITPHEVTANRIQQEMHAINKPEIKPAVTHNNCSFAAKYVAYHE